MPHDRHDVGEIDLRTDLEVRPEPFPDDAPSPFAALEHPEKIVSVGCVEQVRRPGGIGEFDSPTADAKQAIDQHPGANGILKGKMTSPARADDQDVEASPPEPARDGRHVQEGTGDNRSGAINGPKRAGPVGCRQDDGLALHALPAIFGWRVAKVESRYLGRSPFSSKQDAVAKRQRYSPGLAQRPDRDDGGTSVMQRDGDGGGSPDDVDHHRGSPG